MDQTIFRAAAFTAAALIVSSSMGAPSAEARRCYTAGANGTAGSFARSGQYGQSAGVGGWRYGQGGAGASAGSYAGPNGGSFRGGRAGAWKPGTGGFGTGAFQATGANGGTGHGSRAAAWQRGVGGYGQTNTQLNGANGNSYNGFKNGAYNAQTGQGQYNSGKSGTYNSQDYGYEQSTQFTRGQGAQTSIDTVNHGDYTVDYTKGSKPVVTPVPTN